MIGILALQGNYQMHQQILDLINVESIFVKKSEDLNKCRGLIIPGGESTVISKMMIRYNLFNSIVNFSKTNSVFGTCAGLILMTNYQSENIKGLNIIQADILRNGWGRQIDSFTEDIKLKFDNTVNDFKATFIRAPKIKKADKSVNILSLLDKEPIMIREGIHIATTFHPEMHSNPLIHKYFLNIIDESK